MNPFFLLLPVGGWRVI